jgi:hypothetical protein
MIRLVRLLLRPFERFLGKVIAISTTPSAFVRERIRLGDTTNFLRATGFFLSAISTAFLAEVATLYLLGIGNLTEPYYWLVMLVTTIPFILFCFLAIRIVSPLSLKDVLHLSLYPIGAGIFAGAALTLLAAVIIGLLVDVSYIQNIQYDFSQWGNPAQLAAVKNRVLTDCLKENSLLVRVLAAGFPELDLGKI